MEVSISRRSLLAGMAAAAIGCGPKATPGFSGFAFVANEEGQAVAAVDLNALTLVRHVALNAKPTQLLSQPLRQQVYALTPESGTVHGISARTLERAEWAELGGEAIDMRLRGASLWVLQRSPDQLIEVRQEGLQVVRRIALPATPVDFDISVDRPYALVNFGNQVALYDVESGRTRFVDPGANLSIVRFRRDGRQWIAGHRDKDMLSIFDSTSGRIVVRLPLAVRPRYFCFKSDGGQLFVSGEGSDAVAIVFPYSTEVAETVLAGRDPGPMGASPQTRESPEYLFVTNPQASQVTTLSIETRRVMSVTQVGTDPGSVVVTPNNQYALVLNRHSGDMAVLLIASTARRRRFPAALLTMIPVGSRPVSAVVQSLA